MKRLLMIGLVFLMLLGGAFADGRPSGLPEGLSFYEERDFRLSTVWPLEDGTLVLSGGDGNENGALVRVDPEGEAPWRTAVACPPNALSGESTILGAMPDGRLLVRSRFNLEGAAPQVEYGWLDAGTGAYEADSGLEAKLSALGEYYWVHLMSDGYLLGLRDMESERASTGDVVKVGFDFAEQWRFDTSVWAGEKRTVNASVMSDGGVVLHGRAIGGYQDWAAVTGVRKLSADGEEVWAWEGTIDDPGGTSWAKETPDGGVVFARQRMRPSGELWIEMVGLDAGGKALWTKDAGYMLVYDVLESGNIVGRTSYPGDTTGLALYDQEMKQLGEHVFEQIDGKKALVWMQFAKGADGVLYMAGDIGTLKPGGSEQSEFLYGVVYGALDEGFWE